MVDRADMDENYTYIVRCADGTLYTGWTNDLKKRIKAHNSGKGAKYTKTRRPVELVYFEHFATKEEAMSREYHIKQLKHAQKQALIDNFYHFLLQDYHTSPMGYKQVQQQYCSIGYIDKQNSFL